MKVVLEHIQDEADNIATFYFRPEKPVNFTAGQYAEWTIKHSKPDNRGIKRWFTISSSPSDTMVSLTTKFSHAKSSSFKKALRKLKPGDEILMSEPMGDFVLPQLLQTPIIFVAGGIGVTPMHSMLSWLADTKEQRDIKMIYGVPNEDEIIFLPTFEEANQHVTVVVNEPSPSWGGPIGKLTSDIILGLEKPSDDPLIYISGPEPMVESLEKSLLARGIKQRQLVLDFFPNYLDQ